METKKITIESVEHSDQYEEAMKNDALVYSLGSDPEYSGTEEALLEMLTPSEKENGITWGRRDEDGNIDYIGKILFIKNL